MRNSWSADCDRSMGFSPHAFIAGCGRVALGATTEDVMGVMFSGCCRSMMLLLVVVPQGAPMNDTLSAPKLLDRKSPVMPLMRSSIAGVISILSESERLISNSSHCVRASLEEQFLGFVSSASSPNPFNWKGKSEQQTGDASGHGKSWKELVG